MKNIVKKFPFLKQFGKFIITGFINTGIDFGILSLLMWTSGKNQGVYILIFTSISFLAATINSFFLNKYWTFSKKDKTKSRSESHSKDFSQFLVITLGGWLINAGLTTLISGFIPPFLGIFNEWLMPEKLQSLWVLTAKAFATGISLVWNFTGYKLWVFKK
ncbi:MAG: GtrA family protein [Patescibacteria group bacterium]|nr:GtrA family protein [Patescibacteria group bacterium]